MSQHPSTSGPASSSVLTPLVPHDLPDLEAYWIQAHPLHRLTGAMLRERIFGPPPADPQLLIAARRADDGCILGVTAGVFPCGGEAIGGVRWVGALPGPDREAVIVDLLARLEERMRALGARELRMLATPPHYLRPGVDTRETWLIALLLRLGWRHDATHFNMTCDLRRWLCPPLQAIFAPDDAGITVRRGVAADREPLFAPIEREWSVGWRDAVTLAFAHDPIDVFVAVAGSEMIGFAAIEVDQCIGTFGPTGVVPVCRGRGIGRRLLWACLHELRARGRETCQIGWIGPVDFYHRSCGAIIGPTYWRLTRPLE